MTATITLNSENRYVCTIQSSEGVPFEAYKVAISIGSQFDDIDCRYECKAYHIKTGPATVTFSVGSKATNNLEGKLKQALTEKGIEYVDQG